MAEFTHFDGQGNAIMVDVGAKADTERGASACGRIVMSPECYSMVKGGGMKKGDVLGTARIAGIMGAKKTSDLIPLCHNIQITSIEMEFGMDDELCAVEVKCTVKTIGKTGVEMEALTGVNIALLTIYDMCKAVDRGMLMEDIHLQVKSGGKSGTYMHEPAMEKQNAEVSELDGLKTWGEHSGMERRKSGTGTQNLDGLKMWGETESKTCRQSGKASELDGLKMWEQNQ